MTDDPLKQFESLDYPGRRKPVNRDKTPVKGDTPLWDAHPIKYIVAGEQREFFYIGAVAKALGYSVQAIRLWESQNLLPNSPYRSPKPKGKAQAAGSHRGRRIWTRKQIEGILALNREPPTRAFSRDVARLFNQLLSEESNPS
jgi:hypothetical protein